MRHTNKSLNFRDRRGCPPFNIREKSPTPINHQPGLDRLEVPPSLFFTDGTSPKNDPDLKLPQSPPKPSQTPFSQNRLGNRGQTAPTNFAQSRPTISQHTSLNLKPIDVWPQPTSPCPDLELAQLLAFHF